MDLRRKLAVEGVIKVDKSGFSNLVFPHLVEDKNLSRSDRAFVARIFYGTVERKYTLEYIISQFINRPLSKLDRRVSAILKTGLYQILYMDSVPDFAAVNRAVRMCPAFSKTSAKGFVNAVLRKCAKYDLSTASFKDKTEKLSVLYSVAPGEARIFMRDYGEQRENILTGFFYRPPLAVRVNTLKITPRRFKRLLRREGIACKDTFLPECVEIEKGGNPEDIPGWNEGYFFVQSAAARLAVKSAGIQPGETVFDLCAAPGGKSFSARMYMENSGRLLSCDSNPARLGLIQRGADRLGIKNIELVVNRREESRPDFGMRRRVLCDVPCSGLGTLAKKPDIRYKDMSDTGRLCRLQEKILSAASAYLLPGGRLVYSTCTINKDENERQVRNFLNKNPGFRTVPFPHPEKNTQNDDNMITFLPLDGGNDGFFIAVLEKV